jgi:hypothetical protein
MIAATLFSAGCAGTKMANTPSGTPSSPAVAGSLSASNSTLNFGSVQTGSTKTISLVLTNSATQTAAVEISKITVSGKGFAAGEATLPLTLSGGQSITVNVIFNPAQAGAATQDS